MSCANRLTWNFLKLPRVVTNIRNELMKMGTFRLPQLNEEATIKYLAIGSTALIAITGVASYFSSGKSKRILEATTVVITVVCLNGVLDLESNTNMFLRIMRIH